MQLLPGALLLLTLIEGAAARLTFTHHLSLSSGKGQVSWLFNQTTITYQAVVATQGWLGIGISPAGTMAGSDMVVAFVNKKGKPQLHDYHGLGHELPTLDTSQDYKLIAMHKNSTHIVVTFWRKLDTGDRNDQKITNANTNLIWALNNNVPISDTNFNMHTSKGVQANVNFLKQAK